MDRCEAPGGAHLVPEWNVANHYMLAGCACYPYASATNSNKRASDRNHTIPQFSHTERPPEIARALGEVGCVVVRGLLNAADRASVRDELTPTCQK